MTSFLRPDLVPRILCNARVPVALVDGVQLAADNEGLALVDIAISAGRVEAVTPAGHQGDGLDLRGGQVWPSFVDVHTHLDKGHIWERAPNTDGTHGTAARTVAMDRKAHWRRDDITRRFDFGLRCAYAHGTGAMRTHLDSYEPEQAEVSFAVFRDLAAEWRGRIALQSVVMARLDHYDGAAGARLAVLAEQTGGVLGGILKMEDPTPDRLDAGLDRLLGLASAHGLDVDLHVDETDDTASGQLERLADAVLRNRFQGRVTAGHCCSLSMQGSPDAARVIAKVRAASIAVVTLPMVNLYLQGRRRGHTPQWRGITLVHELAAAGVEVAAASDNCRDPFFAFGDHDVLEVFREFTRIGHLDPGYAGWVGAVTRTPARIMRLPDHGRIAVGLPADLVLFRGRGMSELLSRPQADRAVLRAGRAVDTTLPDYADLDAVSDLCLPDCGKEFQ